MVPSAVSSRAWIISAGQRVQRCQAWNPHNLIIKFGAFKHTGLCAAESELFVLRASTHHFHDAYVSALKNVLLSHFNAASVGAGVYFTISFECARNNESKQIERRAARTSS
jgi:hypothetical protein